MSADTKKPKAAEHAAPANQNANQGEGNRTAARSYNEATKAFVASGKVPNAAQDAARAVAGPEAEKLRQAEQEGKRHSRGEDPLLARPGSSPEKPK
jgi:hypothetical protein